MVSRRRAINAIFGVARARAGAREVASRVNAVQGWAKVDADRSLHGSPSATHFTTSYNRIAFWLQTCGLVGRWLQFIAQNSPWPNQVGYAKTSITRLQTRLREKPHAISM